MPTTINIELTDRELFILLWGFYVHVNESYKRGSRAYNEKIELYNKLKATNKDYHENDRLEELEKKFYENWKRFEDKWPISLTKEI